MSGSDDDDRARDDEPDAPDRDDHAEGDDDREPADDDPDDAQPDDAGDESPRVTVDELRAYLSLRDTHRRLAGIVAQSVREDRVHDVVADACARALRSRWLPRRAAMKGWVDEICRRQIADETRKRKRRARHEGPMPETPVIRDETGRPVADPGDAVIDTDPSTDPRAESPVVEGTIARRWMREAVKDDPQDRETFAMMEEWADADEDEATYRAIAEKYKISESALKKRAQRLREKYEPRYRRWRNGMILLLLLGATLFVFALSKVLPRKPLPPGDIRPEPSTHPVAPVPSVPVKIDPKDTEFMPAQPTEPGPKEPPRLKP
jgi:DNA-directed RNA polymerase specialized sigma24 family protein